MSNEKEERNIQRIHIYFPEKVKLTKGSKYLLSELIDLILDENPVKDHTMWQFSNGIDENTLIIDCAIKEIKKEEKTQTDKT